MFRSREGISGFAPNPPPASRSRISSYGWAEMQIRNASYLRIEYIDDQTGNIVDLIEMTK
jgi:hypothetical protein